MGEEGPSGVSQDLRKTASLPDLEKLDLPKHVLSIMSECIGAGDTAADKFLQKKVAEHMKKVLEEKEALRLEKESLREGEDRKRPLESTEQQPTEPPGKQRRESGVKFLTLIDYPNKTCLVVGFCLTGAEH